MSSNGKSDLEKRKLAEMEAEWEAAGLELIDVSLSARPPKIRWGKLYGKKTEKQKIEYLEKLAASMNEAAAKIQDERDELGRLCELKEEQLIKQGEAVSANNMMLQSEVTRMNADRQQMLAEVARLKARIRELEG